MPGVTSTQRCGLDHLDEWFASLPVGDEIPNSLTWCY